MAKLFGINGLLSGKLGNTVFAVTNGVQVARQYNPIVANPKSVLQMQQRAKGNLAGRISSFVPYSAIFGLGRSGRERRSEFLRQLLKSAVVTQLPTGPVAKVADDDVVFSKGSVVAPFSLNNITPNSTFLNVSLAGASASVVPSEDYAKFTARLVVMCYDINTAELVNVATSVISKPEQSSVAVTPVFVNYPAGYTAIVYLIPMSTADGSAASIDSSVATLDDNQIAASLSINRNAVVFDYGHSFVVGTATFTPAP